MRHDTRQPETDRPMPNLLTDERGATTLEWALLLAAIAIPSYVTIRTLIETMVGHYQMMTLLNSLPFP